MVSLSNHQESLQVGLRNETQLYFIKQGEVNTSFPSCYKEGCGEVNASFPSLTRRG